MGETRIVVVGAGIVGAFAAYFLARLGCRAILVERAEVGGGASGNNPGGLNPLHGVGIPGSMQSLALESFALHLEHWDDIGRRSGIDFAPRLSARLHLAADDDDVAQLRLIEAQHLSMPGFSARWLDRADLLALEPGLSAAIERGLWTEGNAKVDPARYTKAIVEAAVQLGAELRQGEVRGLRHADGRVTGVLLEAETIDCDGVVIACGTASAEPARWLDLPLPVEPVKGELLLVEAAGGLATDLAWRDAVFYATGEETLWLGGTEEQAGFDLSPTPQAQAAILERARRVLPRLEHARVVRTKVGLRPVTPDGIPIVGAAEGWANVFLALGGGRKGVLLGSGMGQAVAELASAGETRLSIDPCAPGRLMAVAS
jgi:glycine/D-amino acid oxidase-like deaminating enzyme